MSFLHTQRLFSKPVRLDQYGMLFFDFMLLAVLYFVVDGVESLAGFSSGRSPLAMSPSVFTFFGGLGLYGIRLSMFIAIARRNRAPQSLEWIVTLAGLLLAVVFFAFGGVVLRTYAGVHGYAECSAKPGDRAPDAVFVTTGAPCP